MLEQHGGMLIESPKEYLKIRMRFLPGLCSVPFGANQNDVVLLRKLSQSKRASRRTIIKLANVHARA